MPANELHASKYSRGEAGGGQEICNSDTVTIVLALESGFKFSRCRQRRDKSRWFQATVGSFVLISIIYHESMPKITQELGWKSNRVLQKIAMELSHGRLSRLTGGSISNWYPPFDRVLIEIGSQAERIQSILCRLWYLNYPAGSCYRRSRLILIDATLLTDQ